MLVLRRHCNDITELRRKFQPIDAILEHRKKKAFKFLADHGCVKESVPSSKGLTFNMFLWDCWSVLQSQATAAHSKDIGLESKISSVYSHSLNAEIEQRAVSTAERIIKRSSTNDVSWKYKRVDGVKSAIACIQLLSDKPALSLKAGFLFILPVSYSISELLGKVPSEGRQLWWDCVHLYACTLRAQPDRCRP